MPAEGPGANLAGTEGGGGGGGGIPAVIEFDSGGLVHLGGDDGGRDNADKDESPKSHHVASLAAGPDAAELAASSSAREPGTLPPAYEPRVPRRITVPVPDYPILGAAAAGRKKGPRLRGTALLSAAPESDGGLLGEEEEKGNAEEEEEEEGGEAGEPPTPFAGVGGFEMTTGGGGTDELPPPPAYDEAIQFHEVIRDDEHAEYEGGDHSDEGSVKSESEEDDGDDGASLPEVSDDEAVAGAAEGPYRGWTFRLHNLPPTVTGPKVLWGGGCGENPVRDPPSSSSSSPPPSPSTPRGRSCWSYSAPSLTDWGVSSHTLLTLTYRSITESIPEYTNISLGRDYAHRALTCRSGGRDEDSTGDGGGGCVKGCCKSCSSCLRRVGIGPPHAEIHREVYTTSDVLRTEVVQDGVAVRGFTATGENGAFVGTSAPGGGGGEESATRCKCLRVYLRHKSRRGSSVSMPYVAEGVNRRRQRWDEDDTNRTYIGGGWPENDWGGKDMDDLGGTEPWLAETSEEEGGVHGPVIGFAIPVRSRRPSSASSSRISRSYDDAMIEDAAPLLWKVHIPPDPAIAIEGMTVLEGRLNVNVNMELDDNASSSELSSSSSTSESESAEGGTRPTAVYLNGYQSWSYAGTIARGQPQPTSAMPNILSRAFNRGGTVAPCPTAATGGRNRTSGVDEWAENTGSRHEENDYYYEDDDTERYYYKSDFYACVTSDPLSASTSATNGDGPNGGRDGGIMDSLLNPLEDQTAFASGPSLIIGYLSQRHQFGLVTLCPDLHHIALHASLDGVVPYRSSGIMTDWAYVQICPGHCYDEEPTVHYLNAVAAHNEARPMRHGTLLTGWCSWYHYYENIEEDMLRNTFDKLGGLRNKICSNLALIDDGYMTAWGDWDSLKPKSFPSAFAASEDGTLTEREVDRAMKGLSDAIRSNGMKPGLWIAPFAADKHSNLARKFPDWILRNNSGRAANSSNCGKFFYGLDATNPEVRAHAYRTVKRAVETWGFEVLKLDFLYAACLRGNGRYDLRIGRAEAMDLALRAVRAAAGPDTFLIGCGCPLGSAVGYIDGMRISADTGPSWRPSFPLPSWDNSTLPALRAMIRNSITRSSLGHRWWHNDPDCILLGETTELTDEEVVSAATVVGMTGGMMLMSDDLTRLGHRRLRIITMIYPLTGVSAVALDLHRPAETGIPSLLRLWCTDSAEDSTEASPSGDAALTAQSIAFSPDRPSPSPARRLRNRIRVASGLGTWFVVSLSNWRDEPAVVVAPLSALMPPSNEVTEEALRADGSESTTLGSESELGFHVFAFWSSKYIWIPQRSVEEQPTLSKKLDPHETEIFHIKPVSPLLPQYVGSDLHFTCGYEVKSFETNGRVVDIMLKNDLRRSGHVYVYVPGGESEITAVVNGEPSQFDVVAKTSLFSGRVVRVWVIVHGNGSEDDGRVSLSF